jgi:hypothetical protein
MPYSAIKFLLHPDIIKNIDQVKGRVQLKETAKEAKLKSVWLHGLDSNAIVFKLDKNHKSFSKKSAFLDPGFKDIHKGCDYIIITRHKDRNAIIFCELKSNNHKGAKNQLYCSIPFVDFLISLLKIHKEENIGDYERHYVIFSSAKNLRKQRTGKKLKSETYKNISVKLAGSPPNINIGKIL